MRWLLLGVGTCAAAWLLAALVLLIAGRPSTARELASLLPNLIMLFRDLRSEPGVSRRDKALVLVALIWIASPIDLIPEFIPVLGPLDDALVAALVLRRIVRAAGPDAVRRHWRGGGESLRVILKLAGVPAV